MIQRALKSVFFITLTVASLSCSDAHETGDAGLHAARQVDQPAGPWTQASTSNPVRQAQTGSSMVQSLNGIWHVDVSDPGIAVPFYIMDKHLGVVTWKLVLSGDALTVLEYIPDSWIVPGDDPERFPYKKLKVKDVHIDPRGKWISFTINRGYRTIEAYEAIEFNRFDDGEITGVYRVYDRYGGLPGTGPEYSGSIRLVPYEQ